MELIYNWLKTIAQDFVRGLDVAGFFIGFIIVAALLIATIIGAFLVALFLIMSLRNYPYIVMFGLFVCGVYLAGVLHRVQDAPKEALVVSNFVAWWK